MSTQNTAKKSLEFITYEEYQQKVRSLKSVTDVTNFAKELVAPMLEEMLEAEMSAHVGYEKHENIGDNSGNSRNGYRSRAIQGSFGQAEIAVPRDRNGEFTPKVLPKGGIIESGMEEKIVGLYAGGMSTRDISVQLGDLYGVEVSAQYISMVTNKVLPLVQAWQQRPLASVYPIVYLDGIRFKVRDNGKIVNKTVYVILGVTVEGYKEICGFWIAETEGAKYWLNILTELKNRGLQDILIACIDGLTGFDEAIRAIYPQAVIQRCIVHQIRATTTYVSYQDRKPLCADMRRIYTAPTAEAGYAVLQEVKDLWPQYGHYLQSWETHWNELSSFFEFDPLIRKIIYTTNTIESMNHQFRKVTKSTAVFPHDESVIKRLYLAQERMTKTWNQKIQHWGQIIAQLAIHFPNRFTI